MRVAPLLSPSSHAGRGLAAILALWLAGMAAANADEIAGSAVYGFAEPKLDGMTLTAAPDSSAALVGADFNPKTGIEVACDTSPTGVAHDDGRDVLRLFSAGTYPLQAAEDFIGSASPGRSPAAGEWILRQLDATAPDVAGGFDLANPQATQFLADRSCAWRDGCATPNPDAYPVSRSKSGNIPDGWGANGDQVRAAPLSSLVGPPGTPLIDRVAEAVLDGGGIATLASGASEQAVAGSFRTGGSAGALATDSLAFDLVERLVVHSWNPGIDLATAASRTCALDIGDATGRSVFGPFLGADPSVTQMSSSAVAGP